MKNIKAEADFKQHLIRQQAMFATPALIEKRLRKLMGKARYSTYLDLDDMYHAGLETIDALYEQLQTLEEANTLMSHQAEPTLKVGAALYESSVPYRAPGMHVCEFGCYTGAFTSWFCRTSSRMHCRRN